MTNIFAETEDIDDYKRFFTTLYTTNEIVLGAIVLAQLSTTALYIWNAKKLQEITLLTKVLMVLAAGAGVVLLLLWLGRYLSLS